jgi:hypothetical protein
MKTFLVFCLLACGLRAAGQVSPTPPKRANAVLVQTPDSAAVALRRFATALVSQGYVIEKLDAQFLTLITAPRVIEGQCMQRLIVRAVAAAGPNSGLCISGDYTATILGQPYSGIAQYSGENKGCNTSSFRALERAARAYPAGRVSYAKQ